MAGNDDRPIEKENTPMSLVDLHLHLLVGVDAGSCGD